MSNLLNWAKREWITILVVLGVGLGLYMAIIGGSQRDERDRAAAVAGCGRTGTTKALDAAGWLRAADARRKDGNEAAARYYEGIADGLILTIPAPNDQVAGERILAEVKPVTVKGRLRYVLTDRSARLQHEGCERAYMA